MNIRTEMVQYPSEPLDPDEDNTNRNIPTQKQISPR